MHNQVSSVTASTSQAKSQPTPLPVREMFVEAVEAFANWNPGLPEPAVPFENDDITLSQACQMVLECESPIPKSCRETLTYSDVTPKDHTYSAAARALLTAIRARRSQEAGADH